MACRPSAEALAGDGTHGPLALDAARISRACPGGSAPERLSGRATRVLPVDFVPITLKVALIPVSGAVAAERAVVTAAAVPPWTVSPSHTESPAACIFFAGARCGGAGRVEDDEVGDVGPDEVAAGDVEAAEVEGLGGGSGADVEAVSPRVTEEQPEIPMSRAITRTCTDRRAATLVAVGLGIAGKAEWSDAEWSDAECSDMVNACFPVAPSLISSA